MTDSQLADFKIPSMPEMRSYERREARDALAALQVKRLDIETKGFALVPDADGNISLTPNQLREFFGL